MPTEGTAPQTRLPHTNTGRPLRVIRRGHGELSSESSAVPPAAVHGSLDEFVQAFGTAHGQSMQMLAEGRVPEGYQSAAIRIRTELNSLVATDIGLERYSVLAEHQLVPSRARSASEVDVPSLPDMPDFSRLAAATDAWAALTDPVARLPLHVEMQESVTTLLEAWWAHRGDYPFVWALVPIEAALRHTDEPDVDQTMAHALTQLVRSLRTDMTQDEADCVRACLMDQCFSMWPTNVQTASPSAM